MTLDLNENKCTNPYYTNRGYLINMDRLQVKIIEELTWIEKDSYVRDYLWNIPVAWPSKEIKGITVKEFIEDLNEELMGL